MQIQGKQEKMQHKQRVQYIKTSPMRERRKINAEIALNIPYQYKKLQVIVQDIRAFVPLNRYGKSDRNLG